MSGNRDRSPQPDANGFITAAAFDAASNKASEANGRQQVAPPDPKNPRVLPCGMGDRLPSKCSGRDSLIPG